MESLLWRLLTVLALITLSGCQVEPDRSILLSFYEGLISKQFVWDTAAPTLCGQNRVSCTQGKVTRLYLEYMGLYGTLPSSLSGLSSMHTLNLKGNMLFGTIPKEFGLLKVSVLYLSENSLNGTIPTELALMPLSDVILEKNLLTGTIPTELATLPSLTYLNLASNQLTGTVPPLLQTRGLQELLLGFPNRFCPDTDYSTWAPTQDYSPNLECCTSFDVCQNNATCGEDHRCQCEEGYEGTLCEDEICSHRGVKISGACSCFSGFTGPSCEEDSSSGCPLPPSSPLATSPVGELMTSTSLSSPNTFRLVVASEGREGRHFTSLSLNSRPPCTFPSSSTSPLFSKAFNASSCADVITGTFTFRQLVEECLLTPLQEEGRLVLEGNVHLEVVDPLGNFRGRDLSRLTRSTLSFSLSLPTALTVGSAEAQVYSKLDLMAAVTLQEFSPLDDLATLTISTSAQWPYSTSLLEFQLPAPLSSLLSLASVSVDATSCPGDAEGAPCDQVYTITLGNIVSSGACTFDGDYSLLLLPQCRGEGGCPLGEDSESVAVNMTLVSGELCQGVLEINAALSGTLQAYDQPALLAPKAVFTAGDRLYFLATLVADVELEEVTVWNLRLTGASPQPKTLISDGVPQPSLGYPGVAFGFLLGLQANQVGFSLVGTVGSEADSLFTFSQEGDPLTFHLEADLKVTYRTTFQRKRDRASTTLSLSTLAVLLQ